MLKHRLIFGAIMIAILSVALYFDNKIVLACGDAVGVVFAAIMVIVGIGAVFEMAHLCKEKSASVFLPVAIPCSIVLSLSFFLAQFAECFNTSTSAMVLWINMAALAVLVLACFDFQALTKGTEGTIVNIGATLFTVLYLGFLSSFVMAIRVDFGLQVLLMYIFTVKSSDIGAYTLGRLFGKTKFAPRISPGKTWEGMAGACIFAVIVAGIFARYIESVSITEAAIFGVIFAFAGQLGDLAESMIKRDSGLKDSGSKVPGFGGILDIIDSPVACAALAYLFFSLIL